MIVILVAAGILAITTSRKEEVALPAPVANTPEIEQPVIKPIEMCYQYFKETPSGNYDRALIKINILGNNVTGEYKNLPAEKDSKVGIFAGTVGPMDPSISARTAKVLWNTIGEGMNVNEELNIQFGEGSAVALFGEMVAKNDGTYAYKDPTSLTPGFQMSQFNCEAYDEITKVEKYIRNNVKSIVTKKPVLGGSWYINSVYVNPATKSGKMIYEDGHIQGKSGFTYTIDNANITISLSPLN